MRRRLRLLAGPAQSRSRVTPAPTRSPVRLASRTPILSRMAVPNIAPKIPVKITSTAVSDGKPADLLGDAHGDGRRRRFWRDRRNDVARRTQHPGDDGCRQAGRWLSPQQRDENRQARVAHAVELSIERHGQCHRSRAKQKMDKLRALKVGFVGDAGGEQNSTPR